MTNVKIRVRATTLLSLLAILVLVGCGGGGTSSGGGSFVASVSGTVNSGFAALEQPHRNGATGLFAALGDLIVPVAYAAALAGVKVEVNCGSGAIFSSVTNTNGRFRIQIPNIGTGSCATAFDGNSGPAINVAPGMETEIDVNLNGSSVSLISQSQRPDSSTGIGVDDGVSDDSSSDDLASNDDDDSVSDDDASSDIDDDSVDDQASVDDDSDDDFTLTL